MRRLDLIAFGMLSVVWVGCNGDPAGAGAPRQPSEVGKDTRAALCLTVELPRAHVTLGEPAHAVAVFRNCSDEPIKVRDLFSPDCNLLQVEVQGPDGNKRPWRSPVARECRGIGYVGLAPDDFRVERIPIFFGEGGWFLSAPGEYRIRAHYPLDAGGRVHSRAAVLTVGLPQNAKDASASRALMASNVARTFVLGAGRDLPGELLKLASQTSGTSVGEFTALGVLLHRARGPKCSGVLAELERAAKVFPDPLYAAMAAQSAARCLREAGDEQGATAFLSRYNRSQRDPIWRAAATE